jgi:G:T/U-mismatch repair DNA glycosylase
MDNKRVSTIIIGTAKSKAGTEEYYITERLKMWGVMFIAGFTDKYYQPVEWKDFSKKYCVGFYDVIEGTIPKDKDIKKDLREKKSNSIVYKGVATFFDNLLDIYPNVERIGFNGKTIASWILEFYKTSKISASSKYLKNYCITNFENPNDLYYHDFEVLIKDKKILVSVLPNTSGRTTNFDENPWIKFWQSINNK